MPPPPTKRLGNCLNLIFLLNGLTIPKPYLDSLPPLFWSSHNLNLCIFWFDTSLTSLSKSLSMRLFTKVRIQLNKISIAIFNPDPIDIGSIHCTHHGHSLCCIHCSAFITLIAFNFIHNNAFITSHYIYCVLLYSLPTSVMFVWI